VAVRLRSQEVVAVEEEEEEGEGLQH